MTNPKTLIVIHSYHHGNTARVAEEMAQPLDAQLKDVSEISPHDIDEFDMIGIGAGIDSGKHYQPLLDWAHSLPQRENTPVFVFSTSGVAGPRALRRNHRALRDLLAQKGYYVLDEFNCKGFNTNSVLKHFGGMNKGHPTPIDLSQARDFARKVLDTYRTSSQIRGECCA